MTAFRTRVLEKESDEIVAFIVEAIQGQGLATPPLGYLSDVVRLCHEKGVLVIFDEVKVGMSRTGEFCAFQIEDVVPDVVTLSKALGGGSRAVGAMVTSEELFKKAYGKREDSALHTTTFGGLGTSCAVAIETLNIVSTPDFKLSVKEKGEYLRKRLEALQKKYPKKIIGLRGRGLFQGIQFDFKNIFKGSALKIPNVPFFGTFEKVMMSSLIRVLYKKHNIMAHFSSSDIDILHVMPALIVENKHIDHFVDALDDILNEGFISLVGNFIKDNAKDFLKG